MNDGVNDGLGDESTAPGGSLPAEPALPPPSLPSLPTLPTAAPRPPAAPLTHLWDGDREASDVARRTDDLVAGTYDITQAPADSPLTQAGTTVHRYSAKELAEASRIKAVDNPAYGDLPKANADSQARADELRRQAAKTRARNKRVGRYMAIFAILVMVGIGAVAFVLFQQDEADNDDPPADTAVATTVAAGGVTPLGEQVTIISALDVLNDTPVMGGGIADDLIDDANEVVGNLTATTAPSRQRLDHPTGRSGALDHHGHTRRLVRHLTET